MTIKIYDYNNITLIEKCYNYNLILSFDVNSLIHSKNKVSTFDCDNADEY